MIIGKRDILSAVCYRGNNYLKGEISLEDWHLIASLIVTLAGVFTAVKTLTKPIKDKLDKLTAIESRVAHLESWTNNQQSDLLDISDKLTLAFEASLALLDHAIVVQGGNGKCHEAQKNMEEYMHNRLNRLNSCKEENS